MYNIGDVFPLDLSKFAEIYPELAREAIGTMTLYPIVIEEDGAQIEYCRYLGLDDSNQLCLYSWDTDEDQDEWDGGEFSNMAAIENEPVSVARVLANENGTVYELTATTYPDGVPFLLYEDELDVVIMPSA